MTDINSIISPSAADNFCCHAAEQKWQHLLQYLRSHAADGLLVALSGGVDSAVLLSAAQHAGITPLRSASINSCFITTDELENARAVAKFVNVPHSVLTLDILSLSQIVNNSPERCYHCKLAMYTALSEHSREHHLYRLADGGTAADTLCYRPGQRAAQELDILQPLSACALSKDEIRYLAHKLQLPNAHRPSAACLATRFPYNCHLDEKMLQQVEQAEQIIRELGFDELRVRVHGDLVRLEIPDEQLPRLIGYRRQVSTALRELAYKYITIDLDGLIHGRFDTTLDKELT